MNREEKIALFDAYLSGELSATDRADFERLLEVNEDLRTELDEYKAFSQEIYDGAEYKDIQAKLDKIHGNLYETKKQNRLLILRPKFLIPVGIAAGIALLFMVVNPFNNTGKGDSAVADNEYQELTHVQVSEESSETEEEGYSESQISKELNESDENEITDTVEAVSILDKVLPIVNKTPKGSCFMISNDGFFVTSKHLVVDRRYVKIQQKDRGIAFNAEVVYRDSLLDFAILKCSEKQTGDFKAVPFRFYRKKPELGEDVFTLGYPKPDIVYTEGVVSSETGFRSDSVSFEVSMPSNPGNSGAPLFTANGDLVGMVIANNSKKQAVTYILKPFYIQERLSTLQDSLSIDMSRNYTKRFAQVPDMVDKYRPFIFEVH